MYVCMCACGHFQIKPTFLDVVKMLEDERKQLQDWKERMAFTEDIRESQKVRKLPLANAMVSNHSRCSCHIVTTLLLGGCHANNCCRNIKMWLRLRRHMTQPVIQAWTEEKVVTLAAPKEEVSDLLYILSLLLGGVCFGV